MKEDIDFPITEIINCIDSIALSKRATLKTRKVLKS